MTLLEIRAAADAAYQAFLALERQLPLRRRMARSDIRYTNERREQGHALTASAPWMEDDGLGIPETLPSDPTTKGSS